MRIITFCLTLIFLVTSASAAPKLVNTAAIKGGNSAAPKTYGKKNNNSKNELLISGLITLGAVGLIAILASNHSSSHSSSDNDDSPTPPLPPTPGTQTFEIVNNTIYTDDRVFISVVGTNGYCDWNSYGQCILNTSLTDEISSISLAALSVATVAYQAADKPSLKASSPRLIYLGNTLLNGAKLFITIDNDKAIPVNFTGSGYTTPLPSNSGYEDKKYDYVEFARTSSPDADIADLSAVDFFGLSLKIANNATPIQTAGFDGKSTAEVYNNILNKFAATAYSQEWHDKVACPGGTCTSGIINPSSVGADDPDFGTGVTDDPLAPDYTVLSSIIEQIIGLGTFGVMDKSGNLYTATINHTDNTIDIPLDSPVTKTVKLKLYGPDVEHSDQGFNTYSVFANSLTPTDDSYDDTDTNFHGSIPAAILRGVFSDTAHWNNSAYYTYRDPFEISVMIDPFAWSLHNDAIDNKYYAMGYDDINDNASKIDFAPSDLPVTITINPYEAPAAR